MISQVLGIKPASDARAYFAVIQHLQRTRSDHGDPVHPEGVALATDRVCLPAMQIQKNESLPRGAEVDGLGKEIRRDAVE